VFNNFDKKSIGEHPTFTGDLLTLRVTGTKKSVPEFPATLPKRPHFLEDLLSVKNEDISGRFAVEITPSNTLNREPFSESSIRQVSGEENLSDCLN